MAVGSGTRRRPVAEILAVIAGHDHECPLCQAQLLQDIEERAHVPVRCRHSAVVEGPDVGQLGLARRAPVAQSFSHLGHLEPLGEPAPLQTRRVIEAAVGSVHLVGVDHQEERGGPVFPQPRLRLSKGLFDSPSTSVHREATDGEVNCTLLLEKLVESEVHPVVARHESTLGEGGGPKARFAKPLHQRAEKLPVHHLGRWVAPRQQTHEGRQCAARVAHRALEEDALLGEAIEMGRGSAPVAVGREAVGPQGVEHDQHGPAQLLLG